MNAYIFPGQGSQYVGMGKDLCEQFPEAKKIFDEADSVLGFPLSKICFEGPEEELKQTKNTQPAIFLHSIALWNVLRPSDASMVAGHSLGEYSALVAAEAIAFSDAIKLVRLRGELMQKAGEDNPGTMAAILGMEPAAVAKACAEAQEAGIVQPANFNSPGQIVISGSVDGVRKAMEIAKANGAKRAIELPVSGAFHSPLMQSAKEKLKEALDAAQIRNAKIPLYANVTAQSVTSADEIRRLLYEQVTSPVRWEESVVNMTAAGAKKYIEIGPGKVLQGLVKKISPAAETAGFDKATDVKN
ncbi:MAG: ACP S-malonyltransferase [Bacteroidota bacterium]